MKELLALVRKTRVPLSSDPTAAAGRSQCGADRLKAGKVVGRVVLTPAG